MTDGHALPTKKMIDLVSLKLIASGYKYSKMVKCVPRPNLTDYILFERNMTQGITYTVFINPVSHDTLSRIVRVKRECFYLDNDGE
jgi:hypothetical protein